MAEGDDSDGQARSSGERRRSLIGSVKRRWRAWLRALHRDAGYLAVGLTFVYALSGLLINHVGEIDPNFTTVEETHRLSGPLPKGDDEAAARALVAELGIDGELRDFYFETEEQFEVYLDRQVLIANLATGEVTERREEPRFFFRVANWLHYNRGKAAWTLIADGYAIFLLFLATSGVFMLKGRKGFFGRGALLIGAGALVPILYVHYSGGPGGEGGGSTTPVVLIGVSAVGAAIAWQLLRRRGRSG